MAIKQSADDAAVQDSVKSFVFLLRLPFSDDLAVRYEAANMQPCHIRGSATPTGIVRGVLFLKRYVSHSQRNRRARRSRPTTSVLRVARGRAWIGTQRRADVK